ncbi:MAG: hypothetical protein L3K00_02135 [Thermoplasmata archaeon]|nr:hypothetical protein [Thermoplasmata archaeon]MCI4361581.1 hypothetical protein [Thermoplasmata archaeon]
MRKGLVIVGAVLLIIGVLAAGLTFQQTNTVAVPVAPSAAGATLNTLIDGTMTVSWSGGNSNETFSVYDCPNADCASSGSAIAVGHGGSGSLSFAVDSGGTYAFSVTNGPGVTATVQTDGFVILTFVGIILAALGSFLLVVGIVAKPRVRAAPMEVAPPAAAEAPPSFAGETAGQTWVAGPSGPETIMKARVETPQAAQGSQQYIKCASCGTMNEPWLHNCRWCQRALESTASS